jgi:peptide/histidine transporter 3/4
LEAHGSQLQLWEPDNLTSPAIKELSLTGIFFTLYFANAIRFTAIVYIQDNVSWGLGFGICAIANAISLIVFVLGKRFYRQIKPKGSPFTSIARVMVAAIRKRKILETFGMQDYNFGSTEVLKMVDVAPTKSFRCVFSVIV